MHLFKINNVPVSKSKNWYIFFFDLHKLKFNLTKLAVIL